MNREIRQPITLEPDEAAMVYAVITSPSVGIPAHMTRAHARVLDKIEAAAEAIEDGSTAPQLGRQIRQSAG